MRGPGFVRGARRCLCGLVVGVAGVCALAKAPVAAASVDVDASTRLIESPGWELVRAQCGGCHSYGMITNQRGDRETWLDIIRWMQETQNFWILGADVESAILDYLAENYPPPREYRRAPIPADLMPRPADP
ncbi:MAG: hypothetical protein OXE40_12590 [Gammaproteobacteria bacterium]|nr:hypothetical protein [Gammaproteobacteria bacterium]